MDLAKTARKIPRYLYDLAIRWILRSRSVQLLWETLWIASSRAGFSELRALIARTR